MRYNEKACFLANPIRFSELTEGISCGTLRELERIFTLNLTHPGERVFLCGEPARALYVLDSGEAVLRIEAGGGNAFCRTVEPGEVLGLPEAATGSRYVTSVSAHSRCGISCADGLEFGRLVRLHPRLCLNVVSILGLSIQKGYELFSTTSF